MLAADLKTHINPTDFYGQVLDIYLSGSGWRQAGICPLCRSQGGFNVNLDHGAFKCFACDGKDGTVIDFIMKRDGVKFRRAKARVVVNDDGLVHEEMRWVLQAVELEEGAEIDVQEQLCLATAARDCAQTKMCNAFSALCSWERDKLRRLLKKAEAELGGT